MDTNSIRARVERACALLDTIGAEPEEVLVNFAGVAIHGLTPRQVEEAFTYAYVAPADITTRIFPATEDGRGGFVVRSASGLKFFTDAPHEHVSPVDVAAAMMRGAA